MLSRAAERVYWLGRYIERAENTARLVQQYSQLLLDLPDEVGVGWGELVTIFGADDSFPGPRDDEAAVLRFLVSDPGSVASLATSIRLARDNLRNTRDLLPVESWESVNELNQFAQQHLATTVDEDNRYEVLSDVIARCMQINGALMETMSHGPPYQFLRLGQSIERADMTSRLVDVATAYVREDPDLVARFGSVLGTNVLKSVSGFQMYRQYCHPQIEGRRVVEFLVRDRQFPRAIAYSVHRARRACLALPGGDAPRAAFDRIAESLADKPSPELDAFDVGHIMDRLQSWLAEAHSEVANTWFLVDDRQ